MSSAVSPRRGSQRGKRAQPAVRDQPHPRFQPQPARRGTPGAGGPGATHGDPPGSADPVEPGHRAHLHRSRVRAVGESAAARLVQDRRRNHRRRGAVRRSRHRAQDRGRTGHGASYRCRQQSGPGRTLLHLRAHQVGQFGNRLAQHGQAVPAGGAVRRGRAAAFDHRFHDLAGGQAAAGRAGRAAPAAGGERPAAGRTEGSVPAAEPGRQFGRHEQRVPPGGAGVAQ